MSERTITVRGETYVRVARSIDEHEWHWHQRPDAFALTWVVPARMRDLLDALDAAQQNAELLAAVREWHDANREAFDRRAPERLGSPIYTRAFEPLRDAMQADYDARRALETTYG